MLEAHHGIAYGDEYEANFRAILVVAIDNSGRCFTTGQASGRASRRPKPPTSLSGRASYSTTPQQTRERLSQGGRVQGHPQVRARNLANHWPRTGHTAPAGT